ncbi:uncharacterized protein C8R40DRAFT_1040847, partial [Lentinula edodes]|uniref:uncharacterized protein n=1 Tax=Lentinula edodes TaxID=5353 RepID=UPI001E8EA9C3
EGTESIQTISCDQSTQVCSVSVPAPGAALVFLTNELSEMEGAPLTMFATTTATNAGNTATVDASVLATSNGNNGKSPLGSSSKGSTNGSVVFRESVAGLLLRAGSILRVVFVL